MKVKVFRGPRVVVATLAQGRAVCRGFWFRVRTHGRAGFGTLLLAVALGFLIFPHDADLLARLHVWHGAAAVSAGHLSFFLGTWGDYPTYNLPLALLIWIYGVARPSSAWRRVAVACFLGATLAGIFDDCFRLTLGRPRPDAHVPDGFYGIGRAFAGRFQSFPSGHAASVFGTAMALWVVCRPLGIVTTLYALAVVWARLELYRHYPSDVVVGSIIGIYFGLMVGYGTKAEWRQARAPTNG